MKLLVAGELYGGSLTEAYVSALKNLSQEPKCFDELSVFRSFSHFRFHRHIKRAFFPFFLRLINSELLRVAREFKPDFFLVIKGYHVLAETLSVIKKELRPFLCNINEDDPFNLNRGASCKEIRRSMPTFDCYFTWSKALVLKLRRSGLDNVEYLPFGFDAVLHHPVEPSFEEKEKYSSDVVFVGNWEDRREQWLSALQGFEVGIWGKPYWQKRCRNKWVSSRWRREEIIGKDMSLVLNSSKISLNILREQNIGSINRRTFEVPACGGFVLAERSPEAKDFFLEGKEAVYFSSIRELKDKISYFLKQEKERVQISYAGYQRCLNSGYSYTDRAEYVLRVYEESAHK